MLTSYNSPDSRLRNRIVKFSLIVSFIFIASISFGQLTTDESLTPEEIVQDFFDSGLMITNVEFNGEPEQLGSFDCQNCGIGLTDGFLITNGSVENAEGPNDGPGASHSASMENFYEEDLLTIYPEMSLVINDVTTLEFDFVAAGDSVWFDYVFASEEYNEYIDSSGFAVSDPFGVFVSGPGIDGQFSNGGKNIALIPGTDDYVQIENLNNGENNNGPCVNCEYFITNPADADDPESVEYDGYSTVLTAGIGGLQAGETYHMKIAIADVYDNSYDTGIFFGNQSLHSNKKFVSFHNGEGTIGEPLLVPECSTVTLKFIRPFPLEQDVTMDLFFEGLAAVGMDTEEIQSELVIPAQQEFLEISIDILSDNEQDEGVEDLAVVVQYPELPESFGSIFTETWDMINIIDTVMTPSIPENIIHEDTVRLCNGPEYELHAEGLEFHWFYNNWHTANGSFLTSNDSVFVSPNQTTTYIFTADHECSDLSVSDTITLELPVNLNIELSPDSNSLIAQEDSASLQWLDCNDDFAEIPLETSAQFTPDQPGSYALMITRDSCQFVTDCFEFPAVSVEEFKDSPIEIYPNPVSDILEIRGTKDGHRILLYNLMGEQISNTTSEKGSIKIDLSGFASGVFLLRVSDGEKFSTFRIVKE